MSRVTHCQESGGSWPDLQFDPPVASISQADRRRTGALVSELEAKLRGRSWLDYRDPAPTARHDTGVIPGGARVRGLGPQRAGGAADGGVGHERSGAENVGA